MGIDQHPNHTTGDVFKIFFVPWSGKKPYLLQLLTASYQHLHKALPSADICVGWSLRFELPTYLFVLCRCEENPGQDDLFPPSAE